MKIAKLTLAVAALIIVFGLSSCSKSDTSNPLAPTNNSNLITNQVLTPPSDIAVVSDITEASLESPMEVVLPVDGKGSPMGGDDHDGMGDKGGMGKMGQGHHDRGGFFHLGFIFRDLKLTADQITQVKGFMALRETCQKLLLKQLRDSEKSIIEAANAARKAIMDQVEAGTLSRADAKAQLDSLRKATKALLDANPVRATVIEGLKACEDTFFDNVDSILDSTQKPIWEAFVAKYKAMRK